MYFLYSIYKTFANVIHVLFKEILRYSGFCNPVHNLNSKPELQAYEMFRHRPKFL